MVIFGLILFAVGMTLLFTYTRKNDVPNLAYFGLGMVGVTISLSPYFYLF